MSNSITHKLSKNKSSKNRFQITGLIIFLGHFAFIFRQKVFERARSTLKFDVLDAYAAVDIMIVSFLVLVLLCSRRLSGFFSKTFKSSVSWLLAYYLLCALSAVWSLRPAYSLYRSVEFAVFFISLAVAVSYNEGFEKAERKVLLLSLLSVLVQMGLHLRSTNLLSLWSWHTNAYTASAAVIFVYCAGEYLSIANKKLSTDRKRKKMLLLYGSLSLPLLALGTSSASNVSVLFGIIVILFVKRKIGLMMIIIYVSLLFFMLGGSSESLMKIIFPFKTEQQISTGGGRAAIWQLYIDRIAESPVWGYGLGVLPIKGYSAMSALSHNFIFSILIGTGFLGFTIFFIFGIKLATEMIRSLMRKVDGATGVFGAMAAGFLNSLSMPMIADRWATASFAFFAIFALYIFYVYPYNMQSSKKSYSMQPEKT